MKKKNEVEMKHPILTAESEEDANTLAQALRVEFTGIVVVTAGTAIFVIGKLDSGLMWKVYQFAQKIFVMFYGGK